ncbi:MAG: hypothetical protein WCX23_02630 [Candidatus Paceibacterota bacterium]|jgi:hypothetical protein|nr:hypothetical protein [Candidatus Paceibacterota bacterium]MDD4831079.1 hypothetical protein [Candidatus Paceibacterota bacterium]MDD4875037.1 hypothetical protein [Candidatus Paceibacterota bacterium]
MLDLLISEQLGDDSVFRRTDKGAAFAKKAPSRRQAMALTNGVDGAVPAYRRATNG